MDKDKVLLFIVNVDWFFISHRLPIAVSAQEKGYQVHIACSITGENHYLLNKGIKVHALNISRGSVNPFSEFRTAFQIHRLIKKICPTIIHTITIKPVLYGNIIGRLMRIPHRISSISGLGYVFIGNGIKARILIPIIRKLYSFALTGVQKVIFQNSNDRDIFRASGLLTPDQEVLIRGSGVNLSIYKATPEPEGSDLVLFPARLLVDKGIREFVEAAKKIKILRPAVRMVVVGSIDEENPNSISEKQLDTWVKAGEIEYWGFKDDMPEIITKSNIVVLPSYREGLPKSLIEAAACGRAVITTDVPGCRDAIEPNVTGLLVPKKNVDLLVEAVVRLIDDQSLRRQFGNEGRKLAEKAFDIHSVVDRHLEIYSSAR